MIFRRILNRAREHDWRSAVLDLLVLIVGVFLGLQADNWNQARQAAAQERATVAQLHAEFEAYEVMMSGFGDLHGEHMSDIERLLEIIDGTEDAGVDSPAELLQSATSALIVPLPPTTLRDLIDRNEISQLSNEDLRCLLRSFAEILDFNRSADDIFRNRTVPHLVTLRQYSRIRLGQGPYPGHELASVDIAGLRQDPAAIGAIETLYVYHSTMRLSAEGLHAAAEVILKELDDPEGHVWKTGSVCPLIDEAVAPEDDAPES